MTITINEIKKEEDEIILEWYYHQLKPRFLIGNNISELESNLNKINLLSYKLYNKNNQ